MAAAAVLGSWAGAAAADPPRAQLTAPQLFELADRALQSGRTADAETVYLALTHDPDVEVRSEARFRLGMMLAEAKRYREAAMAFRTILDEKPTAARVRLELARVLALLGDESGARRELRQAQAAGLPADVATVVHQFVAALRSTKPFGGSFEIALAPDSNINRATDAATLDTVIAPLTLDEDAQARSGVGLELRGQAYLRLPVSDSVALFGRLSGSADLYRAARFNDVSTSFGAGPEIAAGRDRIRPALGLTYRSYGGKPYARTQSLSGEWLHPLGKRAQIDLRGSANRLSYSRNPLQSGHLYEGSVAYERAFNPKLGASLTLSSVRHAAADKGYSTISGGIGALAWREAGRTTLFASAAWRRLEGDVRLFPFPQRRSENYFSAGAGVMLRRFAVRGFAPVARVAWERNDSTVRLYDYRRTSVEIGLNRAF